MVVGAGVGDLDAMVGGVFEEILILRGNVSLVMPNFGCSSFSNGSEVCDVAADVVGFVWVEMDDVAAAVIGYAYV